ncbi:MAG TPA: contractile injection system protein, VgrG/Pvc8 family [Rhodocyclaceae bacterium]|nr:contractile injection system protein, VgrG/Pvc8 family [Rhodocyclaceae bacterium]
MAETPVAQSAIYSARPTVRIAGQADPRITELVMAMRMDEHEGGMSSLDMRFSNLAPTTDGGAELAFDSNSTLKLGADIAVYAGDATQPREIFRGKVTAMELEYKIGNGPELTVLAEDALSAARRARQSKVYTDKSPADVVRAIASDLGLTPTISGLDSPTATWAQINESDLSFLRRLLARFDADMQIVGTDLQVSARKDVNRGTLELALFGQLAKVRVIADLAEQVSTITTSGWNAKDGNKVTGSAAAGTNLGGGSGRDGKSVLEEALESRAEHIGHLAVATNDEAQAVAEAAFDLRARRFVRAEGTTEGNAQLRVGASVKLTGISPQFDNTYYVSRACHIYDLKQGYRTEFSAECAYLGS